MGRKRKIAITAGDPAGVGAEVTLKALLSDEIKDVCRPLVIADRNVLLEAIEKMDIPLDLDSVEVLNLRQIRDKSFERCKPTAEGGQASVAYIRKAVELASLKVVDAIVTAPISKESLKIAGFPWPGHTEMLAELTGTSDFAMMLCGGPLRVILVTIHRALRDVPGLITRERVLRTIVLANRACSLLHLGNPSIAVAGLNPHAGEAGMFGVEEIQEIAPAVAEAQGMGIPVSGPYPADTLFHRAYQGHFDIIVCMYHDQGLTPLKMIAFESGVNVTVGLPIVRTSPDHGTAYDRAWTGSANPSSMKEAIKLAARLGG